MNVRPLLSTCLTGEIGIMLYFNIDQGCVCKKINNSELVLKKINNSELVLKKINVTMNLCYKLTGFLRCECEKMKTY